MKMGRLSIAGALLLMGLVVVIGHGTGLSSAVKSDTDDCSRWRAERERIKTVELPANQTALREANDQLNSQKKSLTQALAALTAAEVAGVGISLANRNRDHWKGKVDETTRQVAKLKGREKYLNGEVSRLETRIKEECAGTTSEPPGDDWQKAIGEWRNKAGTLVFELVDMNKADREYHPDEPIKVDGYVRKVPPTWSDKIHAGELIFISNKVEGGALSGQWIQAPQKGDCPKMAVDYSSCTLKINTAGETLTSKVESKQYAYPKCQWSDKVVSQTFTYFRVK